MGNNTHSRDNMFVRLITMKELCWKSRVAVLLLASGFILEICKFALIHR